MKKVFLFAKTEAVVTLGKDSSLRFTTAVESALDRTVIVQTSTTTGAGAIVGDRVITSLLLVANVSEVFIRFRRGKKMSAFVTRRDHTHSLAELMPSSRALSCGQEEPLVSSADPRIGTVREIGDPLLVVNVGSGVPSVNVAGTRYLTHLAERFEEKLKINSSAPRGLIGGGVWSVYGEFVGLSLGEKIPPEGDPTDRRFPSVYALPAGEVMEFVES